MTTVVAHVDCQAEQALAVSACAETHPTHVRHAWLGGRLHVHLDPLGNDAERRLEAARVERWLDRVARGREPISWETWCAREDRNR